MVAPKHRKGIDETAFHPDSNLLLLGITACHIYFGQLIKCEQHVNNGKSCRAGSYIDKGAAEPQPLSVRLVQSIHKFPGKIGQKMAVRARSAALRNSIRASPAAAAAMCIAPTMHVSVCETSLVHPAMQTCITWCRPSPSEPSPSEA